MNYSCPAPPKSLDNPLYYQRQRTEAKTEALIMTQDVSTLWSEHGIVSDVIVSLGPDKLTSIYLRFHFQPFTNDFPRADIHELIAPDLLHQVIKGTFKDHLVTWVGEYLLLTHGRKKANHILDDIDHRYLFSTVK